jgi:hypothetical protein
LGRKIVCEAQNILTLTPGLEGNPTSGQIFFVLLKQRNRIFCPWLQPALKTTLMGSGFLSRFGQLGKKRFRKNEFQVSADCDRRQHFRRPLPPTHQGPMLQNIF